MPRLLSVSLTEPQVRARLKTETRRLGWWEDKHGNRRVHPGDQVTLVDKCMGFKAGESPLRIADVELVEVRRERLDAITPAGVVAEGFPDWTTADFVNFFCRSMKCTPDRVVTVLRWRYLDVEAGTR